MTSTPSGSASGPEKIGRYKILGELGRGAMGRVYRAFDPNIGRNIALKVIPLDSADPELAMRFRREAQAAGLLSHPNIVTIFDAGDDGGFLYIAMELVDGPTLQQMLASGPLPVEKVISLCEQAGAALDHAHARAIIHRDIKPANLMVQAGVVKITDFGVAKSGAAGMTSTGQVLGTPQYLAPEVVKGGAADARSDIFSFGVVLYEMLTAQRAFPGDNISTVIYRIISEAPRAPSLVISSLPAGLNYVVMKALAKEPEERYGSCAELVADLKNYPALEAQGTAAAQRVNAPPPFPDLLTQTAKMPAKTDLGATQPHLPAAPAPRPSSPAASRKQSGWPRTGLVAGLAVALVLGAIVWRSRTAAEPDPSALSPEATPAAISSSAPPATAPASTPANSGSGPPSRPAAASATSTPATPPLRPETAASTPAPAAAAMGRLVIHTEPVGALILIDGVATSYRTPVNFALAPGQHRITLEYEGYETVTHDVMVEANRAVEIRRELEKTESGGILRRIPFVRR